MKKIALVYASQYGVSKHYAKWIAKRLGIESHDANDFHGEADLLIYGAGLYNSRVKSLKQFAKDHPELFRNEWVLFTTGLSSANHPVDMKRVRDGVASYLSPEVLQRMKHFHFPGALDFSKLSFPHKLTITAVVKLLEKKADSEQTELERRISLLQENPINLMNERAIEPLIDYVQGNMSRVNPETSFEIRPNFNNLYSNQEGNVSNRDFMSESERYKLADAQAVSEMDTEVETHCDDGDE